MRKLLATLALLALLLVPAQVHAGTHWVSPKVRWTYLGVARITGYTETGLTATGTYAGPGQCAVNPAWVRYGSILRVDGLWTCRATDTGGFGPHWVDMWVPTVAKAYQITGYRKVWLRLR